MPVCKSRLSSSWRPLRAMDMSALYPAIDTADSAPLPASRERLRAGSRDRSNDGQLERAASSRSVCFFVGCCHRSGCVFASYASRWLSRLAIATPSGVNASCTVAKSWPNSASRAPSVSAPDSSSKYTSGAGQSTRACSSSCRTLNVMFTTAASVLCSRAPHSHSVELGRLVQLRQQQQPWQLPWQSDREDEPRLISASMACMMGSRELEGSSAAGGAALAGATGASISSRCSISW
mmetsp:Transcript_23779/g.60815  ORF Transcript_23779/g.60815 Transcript_23779/m.60815 type:complete len:236 (-) Transcript_23779:202-909(-)